MGLCNPGQGPALLPVPSLASSAQSCLLPGWCPRSSPPVRGPHRALLCRRHTNLLHHLLRPSSCSTITTIQAGRLQKPLVLLCQDPPCTRGLCTAGDLPTVRVSSAGASHEGFRTALRQQSLENNCRFSVYTHFCFQLFSSAYSAGGLYAPHYQAIASVF